jgi:predicted ATPase
MMMAFDSSQTPPSGLDDGTIASVRAALRVYISDARDPLPLRAALLAMATEARTKSILPEHLLIVLKDIWSSLAEVRDIADVAEQVRMQQRVVTMCIREYYSA